MSIRRSLGYSLAGLVCAMVLAAGSADAAMPTAPLASGFGSDIQLVAAGCGPGFHRNLWGYCRHNAVPRRHCPVGLHAVSFPNGSGYRCVAN